jgi:Protein of unknown function (DUF2877)
VKRTKGSVFSAAELGTEAGRIITSRGSAGKVFAALSGIIYFMTDEQEFFWLSSDPFPMHRRCIRLEFLPARHQVRPGQRFSTRPLRMKGDSFFIDLHQAKEWNPPAIFPAPEAPGVSIEERCEHLIGFMRCLNSEEKAECEISSLLAMAAEREIPPASTSLISSKVLRAAFEIGKACRRQDMIGILEKGKELIGLGPGLTPSGDDFMGGLLFSVHFLKKIYPETFRWDETRVTEFVQWARSRTNPISHAFLGDFTRGHGPAHLYGVMRYLLQGRDFEEAVSAGVKFMRFGHSSGEDILAGLMTGMRMAC